MSAAGALIAMSAQRSGAATGDGQQHLLISSALSRLVQPHAHASAALEAASFKSGFQKLHFARTTILGFWSLAECRVARRRLVVAVEVLCEQTKGFSPAERGISM
jgi:hypothetical protein